MFKTVGASCHYIGRYFRVKSKMAFRLSISEIESNYTEINITYFICNDYMFINWDRIRGKAHKAW